MNSSECRDVIDNTWGPWAGTSCRGGFDFTLLFEETILGLLPLCIFLLICPSRLSYLVNKTVKVVPSILVHLKLVLWILFIAAELILLIFWTKLNSSATQISVPLAVLAVSGGVLGIAVSYLEHQRTIRPSTILSIWLFVTLLCDCARTRTLWFRQQNSGLPIIMTIATSLKAVLLLIESIEKQKILLTWQTNARVPESTAGIFNRFLFIWLNPLFKTGYSQNLQVEMLFDLDRHLTSSYLAQLFKRDWKFGHAKAQTLQRVVFKTLTWPLLAVVVPRAALAALQFAQPFLINSAIDISNNPDAEGAASTGIGLIGAYILVYIGIAVSTGQYWHNNYRAITMARGGLISLLYTKLTDISVTTANANSLTLMSADIERIANGWQTMHEIWSNVIEIAIAIWLLQRQLGAACAIPIGVAIVSIMGLVSITSLVVSRQAIWLQAIERRIEATTAMLKTMKGVKMSGLAEILTEKIQMLRAEELRISSKFRQLLIFNMAFAYLTPIVAPVVTFTVFSVTARNAGGNTTLDTARVFTSLSLFALLSDPLASLMIAVVQFAGAAGSLQRIQEFLEGSDRIDHRVNKSLLAIEEFSTSTRYSKTSSNSSDEKLHPPKPIKPEIDLLENAFVIQKASFGWTQEKPQIVSDITVTIPRGKFVVVVGPVGCGKSTFLKGLLGEVPQSTGTIEIVNSEIAYCDQTPWHTNTTVVDSILGVSSFDPAWYHTVVEACALNEDFLQLAKGDNTKIGSSGTALSGGQSQRIALARAVYANKRLVLLDDTLSGLDATTEQKVFHNLLGEKGLLRQSNTTVVLVSSSSKRLPFADLIVAIGADGKIVESGTFTDLNAAGGYVASFGHKEANWTVKPTEEPEVKEEITDESSKSDSDVISTTQTIEEEEKYSGDGDVQIYIYYIGTIGWTAFSVFIFAISCYAIFFTFPSIWTNWWSAANDEDPNGNLGYWLGVYGVLAAGSLISLVASVWHMLINIMPKSGEGIHFDLLRTVLRAPMSFFSTTDIGITINRFSQDIQLIDMDLPLAVLNTCITLVLVIAQMAIIGVESTWAAICFPICLVIFYFVQKFYLRTSRQMRLLDIEAKSPLYTQFLDCINGLITIRAFGWSNALVEKNLEMLEYSQKPYYLFWAIQRWLVLVLDLIVAGIAVLLIILVVTLRGSIAPGSVGVILYSVILFSTNIKLLLQFWTNLETHIGAVARVKTFTEETKPEDLPTEKRQPPETWPSAGEVEFRNVFASYTSASHLVLKDVSLNIKAGSKVAICGRTGSGKSSLLASIFRMLDVCAGSIIIDGINLASMPRQTVRSRITGIPQDSMLLPGNVRFNIDPVEKAVDGALIEALTAVELWDIVKEKGGLDAKIEDIFLTHGQRQLFCLARAMIRSSTILILDEATSSVDGRTDALMQRLIRQKFANHTIICVAHKLETILDFDRIIVLDAGCIRETGSPYELLANAESEFSKLYKQFSAEKSIEWAKGNGETVAGTA